MKLTDNTIFITGGGTGIGRGLAEALHKLGNKVIISGRRKEHLDATTKANPGMDSVELDISDPANIAAVTKKLIADYPALNVLINNAGIMLIDDAAGKIDDQLLTSTVTTNLLGPIRLTSALIEHLKKQPKATVIYNTSALAFVPACVNRGLFVHEGGPAFVRPFAAPQTQRRLQSASWKSAPPWVQTDLLNSKEEPRAMPLKDFIEETMKVLGYRCERDPGRTGTSLSETTPDQMRSALVTQFNDSMIGAPPQ